MDFIVRFLPAAVCAGGMILCMRMMSGMHRRSSEHETIAGAAGRNDIETLRDEVARLRSELGQRQDQLTT